jgi:hypothetical protein
MPSLRDSGFGGALVPGTGVPGYSMPSLCDSGFGGALVSGTRVPGYRMPSHRNSGFGGRGHLGLEWQATALRR